MKRTIEEVKTEIALEVLNRWVNWRGQISLSLPHYSKLDVAYRLLTKAEESLRKAHVEIEKYGYYEDGHPPTIDGL